MHRWSGGALVVALLALLALVACDDARAGRDRGEPAASAPRDEASRDEQRRPDALIAALEIQPGARIADVGAGDGYLTTRLAAAAGPTGRVVATDIDEVALRLLGERLATNPAAATAAPVEAREVAADEPGLEPAAYDLVVLVQVDQYLADRAGFLRRLAAALAPGGRIAVANRVSHRAALLAAAAEAGLAVRDVTAEGSLVLPAEFLVILTPEPQP